MKINSENCEAWFLDYYEGNLSKEGVEELFAFLTLNPELRELFDSYDEVSFSPDKQISFDWKSELKKPVDVQEGITESNYEEYFVSHVEGLLSAEGKTEVEKFLLQFPAKREELELLQKAILIPDEEIVFEHKASLHKSILIAQENFDEMAIASIEGLLNKEEEKALAASLAANEEQQKSYALFSQTKLSPDTSIVFEDKESLKQKERGAAWWVFDMRFAAAAAVVLLMGIFYWNYSGNETAINGNDGIAAADTSKPKPSNDQPDPKKDALANDVKKDNAPKVEVDSDVRKSDVQKNQLANVVRNTDPVKAVVHRKEFIPTPEASGSLNTVALNPSVDFSDVYYSYTNFSKSAPVVSSGTSISPRQAAMRWMKRKLDRTPGQSADEDATYIAGNNSGNNGDVSGFDLTSSAISALGNATGSNLRLGHESEGTVLTVGKYELLLNRNN
jgi:hypothetical protein